MRFSLSTLPMMAASCSLSWIRKESKKTIKTEPEDVDMEDAEEEEEEKALV